jgi:hypothetical protein
MVVVVVVVVVCVCVCVCVCVYVCRGRAPTCLGKNHDARTQGKNDFWQRTAHCSPVATKRRKLVSRPKRRKLGCVGQGPPASSAKRRRHPPVALLLVA